MGFGLKKGDDLLGRNAPVEVDVQHSLYYAPHGRAHHDLRVVVLVQDLVQVGIYAALFCNYFREKPAFDCEKALLLQVAALLARHQERKTHPQRNPYDDFQQHAAQTPHVDRPRMAVISHHLLV